MYVQYYIKREYYLDRDNYRVSRLSEYGVIVRHTKEAIDAAFDLLCEKTIKCDVDVHDNLRESSDGTLYFLEHYEIAKIGPIFFVPDHDENDDEENEYIEENRSRFLEIQHKFLLTYQKERDENEKEEFEKRFKEQENSDRRLYEQLRKRFENE